MKTILYYPTIEIPNGIWLKQALLYWDKVGSIVPKSYDEWADEVQKERYGLEIKYLKEENAFIPFNPQMLLTSWDEVRLFIEEFKSTILSEKFQKRLVPKEQRCPNTEIYEEKFTGEIFDFLVEHNLAKPKDNYICYFEINTYHLYMSLLAKYLARVDMSQGLGQGQPKITVTGTDQEHKVFSDLCFNSTNQEQKVLGLSLFLKNTLVVPADSVSFQRILTFKRSHYQQLRDFQQVINNLEEEIKQCSDVKEVNEKLVHFKNDVERSTTLLEKEMKRSFIDTTVGSLQALIKSSPGILTLSITGLALGGVSIAALPLTALAGVTSAGAAIEILVHLFKSSNSKEETVSKNAFSYIYFANEELNN